jgi:uncharacterized protein
VWRRALWTGVTLVVLTIGGISWYYAGQILAPGAGRLPKAALTVQMIGDDAVTLNRTQDSVLPGRYGLRSENGGNGGFVQVGEIVDEDASSVTRTLFPPLSGSPEVGEVVSLETAFYPADPDEAFGFKVEEVTLQGELGVYPAYVDRRGNDRWAILVHGRGGTRRECFRMMHILHERGISSIAVTYRNDDGAPSSPNGLYALGATEWQDVVPAVRYALDQGAQELVLVGFSMGGQIVAQFLHEAAEADRVEAVILDAPVLDWRPVLYQAARVRRLPGFLTDLAIAVAQVRAGISFAALDQVACADEFDVPILLFHGTADAAVPIATSQTLTAARPELVRFVPVSGAGHVGSWNVDPDGYSQVVGEFLGMVAGKRQPSVP